MQLAPSPQIPCTRCSVLIEPERAYLTGSGPVCDACQGRGELDESFTRAAKYYSAGSLGAALVSIVYNPLMILSVIALVLGVRGLVRLTAGQLGRDYAEVLGSRRTGHIIACAAAVALALLFGLRTAFFVAVALLHP